MRKFEDHKHGHLVTLALHNLLVTSGLSPHDMVLVATIVAETGQQTYAEFFGKDALDELLADEPEQPAGPVADEDGWISLSQGYLPDNEWLIVKVDGCVPTVARFGADYRWEDTNGDTFSSYAWPITHYKPLGAH